MSNQLLLVSKDVNYGASKSSTAANSATYPHQLRDGALGWFDASDNTLIDTGLNAANITPTDIPNIFLAQGVANGANIVTPIINRDDIAGWNGYGYSSGQTAIQIVGYDGNNSSLDINATDDTSYNLIVRNLSDENYNENHITAGTKSDANNSNSFDIARKTAEDFNSQLASANLPYGRLSPQRFVRAEILSSATGNNVETGGAADITGTVTKDSKVVQLSDTPGSLTAGDTLRIGSTSTQTDPVYYVTDVDTSNDTATLSMPYQGDDASGVDLGRIAGKPTGASTGLRFESTKAGIAIHVALQQGFIGTVVTNSQVPQIPTNDNETIARLEEKLQGKLGHYNKRDVPFNFPTFVQDGVDYDTYHVKLASPDVKEMGRIVSPARPFEIIVAVPDSPGTLTKSDFEVINNWFSASPLNYANVTL